MQRAPSSRATATPPKRTRKRSYRSSSAASMRPATPSRAVAQIGQLGVDGALRGREAPLPPPRPRPRGPAGRRRCRPARSAARPARRGEPAPGRPARPGGGPACRARASAPRPDVCDVTVRSCPRAASVGRAGARPRPRGRRSTDRARRRGPRSRRGDDRPRSAPCPPSPPASRSGSGPRRLVSWSSAVSWPAAPAGRRSARNDGGRRAAPTATGRSGSRLSGGDRRARSRRFEAADGGGDRDR